MEKPRKNTQNWSRTGNGWIRGPPRGRKGGERREGEPKVSGKGGIEGGKVRYLGEWVGPGAGLEQRAEGALGFEHGRTFVFGPRGGVLVEVVALVLTKKSQKEIIFHH